MTVQFAQTHDRRLFHNKLLQRARFLQQARQSRMHLRWGIESRQEHLPLLVIQPEALPVSQGFSRAGLPPLPAAGSAWPLESAAGPASHCARGMTSSLHLL